MANTVAMTGHSALQERLPDLQVSLNKTTNHALHQVYFVGRLAPWPTFRADVANTFQAETWSPQVINMRIVGPNAANSIDTEHVYVSCETDVQGRLRFCSEWQGSQPSTPLWRRPVLPVSRGMRLGLHNCPIFWMKNEVSNPVHRGF